MQFVAAVLFLIFPALLILAALSDLTTMKISNKITGGLILAFVPAAGLALLAGAPLGDILGCVGVGVVGMLVGMIMFGFKWIGGGDAKLIGAAALWLGLPALPGFLIWTAISGGMFALALLSGREWAHPYVAAHGPRWMGQLLTPSEPIPYGVAICIGGLAAASQSPLWQAIAAGF